jgi:hypothetical protein
MAYECPAGHLVETLAEIFAGSKWTKASDEERWIYRNKAREHLKAGGTLLSNPPIQDAQ